MIITWLFAALQWMLDFKLEASIIISYAGRVSIVLEDCTCLTMMPFSQASQISPFTLPPCMCMSKSPWMGITLSSLSITLSGDSTEEYDSLIYEGSVHRHQVSTRPRVPLVLLLPQDLQWDYIWFAAAAGLAAADLVQIQGSAGSGVSMLPCPRWERKLLPASNASRSVKKGRDLLKDGLYQLEWVQQSQSWCIQMVIQTKRWKHHV